MINLDAGPYGVAVEIVRDLQFPIVPERPAMAGHHVLAAEVHLILINTAGEILFGQRQGGECANAAWQLPAGPLNKDESVVAALIRAARTTTGVLLDERDLRFCHVMPAELPYDLRARCRVTCLYNYRYPMRS